jgi:hypothetical protein
VDKLNYSLIKMENKYLLKNYLMGQWLDKEW